MTKNNKNRTIKELEFIFNWKAYDEKGTMFWISLVGTPSQKYVNTIKIERSGRAKPGRSKFIAVARGECLSIVVSHDNVSQSPKVHLFNTDILKEELERGKGKKLRFQLVIRKK